MAQILVTQPNLNETELEALARVAKPKLYKHTANISGFYRSRTLINGGNDYAGLREYSPGDEVRAINWLASARSKQFQVHQHQQERGARWFICLDASASMGVPEQHKWQLALELVDAFAYILLAGGNQVGLVTFNEKVHDYCPLGPGRHQYKKIHQVLQQLQPKHKGGNSLLHACLSHIKQKASVIVVSDFLQADFMKQGLDRFRKSGHHLHAMQVLSQHESELSEDGLLTLFDIETGETMTIESTPQTHALAEHWLRQQSRELQIYCSEHRINYSFSSTNQHWKDILVKHISNL
jgi:uncharacterized protein (DUF58 family)